MKGIVEAEKLPAHVLPFVKKIHMAYAAPTSSCRAGAMTLAEIAVCGLPAILVPYPYAAHNHREDNAANLVDRGAAVMILDAEAHGRPSRLREVARTCSRTNSSSRMSSNARLFAGVRTPRRVSRVNAHPPRGVASQGRRGESEGAG